MTLWLASLDKVIAQLEEALAYCHSEIARSDARLAVHLRAGAIQGFEYTYELSVKMLKRYLQTTDANPNLVDELSFNDLIRRGYELGLLNEEIAIWRGFRRDRGTTSHTYDETKAVEVFQAVPRFLAEAKFLSDQIAARQQPSTGDTVP